MAKTVEPPILMSRILAFVLIASVVVLATLVFTLVKMAPLERPEVFFLLTPTRLTNLTIQPLEINDANKEAIANYTKGFIREYIIARNTIDSNASVLKNNWHMVVKPWSSDKVWKGFINTSLYKKYTSEQFAPVSCSVNFPDSAIIPQGDNMYLVNFIWLCKNIGGQTTRKNYRIQMRIQSDVANGTSGIVEDLDKLSRNPLGTQVVQYVVIDKNNRPTDDPLDSDL